jgi:hypothetical protein
MLLLIGIEVCGPIVDTSNSRQFWPLDQIGNCLTLLAITISKDCHFEFLNRRRDAKVMRGESGNSPFPYLITYALPIALTILPRMVSVL